MKRKRKKRKDEKKKKREGPWEEEGSQGTGARKRKRTEERSSFRRFKTVAGGCCSGKVSAQRNPLNLFGSEDWGSAGSKGGGREEQPRERYSAERSSAQKVEKYVGVSLPHVTAFGSLRFWRISGTR